MKKNKRSLSSKGHSRMRKRKVTRKGVKQSLNVRVNSKKSVSVRRKIFFVRFLKWTALTAMIFVVLLGSYRGVDRFLFESPKFALSNINYKTDGELPQSRVLKNSGIVLGQNILRVDIKDAKERILNELPMIKEVEIIRQMPGDMTIKVSERVPVAWLSGQNTPESDLRIIGGILLDSGGNAFAAEEPVLRFKSLPVMISSEYSKVSPGYELNSMPVQKGLEIALDFNDSFRNSPVILESLHSRNDFSIIGYINTGAEITFGFDDIPRQISDLKLLLAEATRRGRVLAEANVMVKRNTPVKFANNFISDSTAPRAVPVTTRSVPNNQGSKKKSKTHKKLNKVVKIPRALPIDAE